tara:strand:- start:1043 stop:1753 length:711 start_codon:yes stop_codon:yes gene_type:complete
MPKKLNIIEAPPISDDESVSSSGSEIEQVEPKRKGRGKNKQVTEESVIKEIVEDTEKQIKKVKKEKLIKPKKVKEPEEPVEPEVKLTKTGKVKKEKLIKPKKVKEPEEPEEPVEPEVKLTKTGKVKKEVTPERREQLRIQLEKGRKTRADNFARKKAEKAELVEKMKIKIAEPVVKETIIKEKKTKKPKKIVEYVSESSSSSSSEEEVIVKKKSKAKKEVVVKIPEKIPTKVFHFV